jgi:hypothetical protein
MASTTLNTWKEISAYTGRGIRTVQRWELSFDFPIHRPSSKSRSAVFALSHEVDHWFLSRPMLPADDQNYQSAVRVGLDIDELSTKAHELRAKADETQLLMQEIQKNVRAALGRAERYQEPS